MTGMRAASEGKPAQSFAVTVKVEELAQAGELRFETRRIGPLVENSRPESVTMRDVAIVRDPETLWRGNSVPEFVTMRDGLVN